IMWAKDLGRSLDWAETRRELDSTRVAYYGLSWGAVLGPIMLAVHDRLKVGVWISGGLEGQDGLPEADPVQFLGLGHQPVLMLNGRYDFWLPVEESQSPMFKLLGTPATEKRSVLSDSGHSPPMEVINKEGLDWLDRYLGPIQ